MSTMTTGPRSPDGVAHTEHDPAHGRSVHSTIAADFEAGTLDNSTFGHPDHVRVIWSLIHAHGTLEALARFETGLKRLTAAAGRPGKYHATITHAFAFLVGERIAGQGRADWDEFVDANPDLFDWPNSALARLYPGDVLHTQRARDTFVMPSRDSAII